MIENNYPSYVKHILMNLLGSHDTRRIASILKEKYEDNYFDILKIVSGLQFTFYGLPSIFYGDEVGALEDAPDFCRVCYPWDKENDVIKNWYKTLAKIRKYKVFKNGAMEVVKARSKEIVFKRVSDKETILVITNLNEDDYVYCDSNEYKSLINGEVKEKVVVKPNQIDILIKINKK